MSIRQQLSFTIVPDSNVLYPKEQTRLVGETFLSALSECAEHAKLRLLIPEVVRGERLFRLVRLAKASLENAKKNFDNLKTVSDSVMPPLPTIATLRTEIEKRFDKWVAEIGAEIVPTPCEQIDWSRVVTDAVWRQPPFSDGENTEKGFRDCLILETLAGLITPEAAEQVIFISGDQLLRETAIARFDSRAFAAYESMEAFHSFLTVTRTRMEEARKQFVQSVIQSAPATFYSADNPRCVYTFYRIYQRIMQCNAELNHLHRPTPSNEEESFFAPVSEEKVFIDSTEYEQSLSKYKRWGWKTRIRLVRLFQKQTRAKDMAPIAADSGTEDISQKWVKALTDIAKSLGTDLVVRIAPFEVRWAAIPDGNGKLQRPTFLSLKALPHEEEAGFSRFRYGLASREEETKPANLQ